MSLSLRIIVVFAKLFSIFIRALHVGTGFTWPGELALRIRPSILREFADQRLSIVLVSGTNGKTTTVKMTETILKVSGKRVKRNPSGANLDNGLVSVFIDDASWTGRLRTEYFVFEVDEATLFKVANQLNPRMIVLLNLFRDQLDRYGEVDTIAEKWLSILSTLSTRTQFILNGDDPHIAFIGSTLPGHISYYGLDDVSLYLPVIQHATDSLYCPKCGNRLTFGGVYYAHLGKWACGKCGFTHPDLFVTSADYASPIPGIYNIYNTLAAASICKVLGLLPAEIQQGLLVYRPAFGRYEEVTYHGKHVTILLSKNPAGFNESLRTVMTSDKKGPILFLLNDRIPDGTDVSWIWDVDFETVADGSRRVAVSGDRCYDMSVRIKYSGIFSDLLKTYESIAAGIDSEIQLLKENETLWILPTYSAMLDARKHIIGRKIM